MPRKAPAISADKDIPTIEYLDQSTHGFVDFPYYPPSRHLRAAQAALNAASVYTTTSKQQRANKDPSKKLTAQDVQDFLQREGYISEDAIISDNFEDPYVDLDKWRFHDSYRRDSACRRALNVLADFTLGQRTKNTLDITQDYNDEKQQQTAFDQITNNPTYQAYAHKLDEIDKDVSFDHFLTAAFIQAKVFGRACILIQDDPDSKIPVALKLISSMRLGRVFIDELTWTVVAVEYLDYEGYQSIIPAQNMIYFTNMDFAISPNVYGYGYSDVEPVIDIAEINRQLWSVAIKEINKSEWAPYLIVKMNTKRKSQMQKVADNLKPGIPFIHNQDITFQTIEMHHDLEKIMAEIAVNETTICYTLGVPTFLVGKEDVTNRATTATIMDSWSKSKLEKERTWLRGIIEPQWNDRNLKRIIESGIVEQNLPPDQPPMQSVDYPDPRTGQKTTGNVNPNNPFASGDNAKKKKSNPFAKSANAADFPPQPGSQKPQDQSTQDQSTTTTTPYDLSIPTQDVDISALPFKIKREFEPIVLDTLFETAGPIVQLIDANVIDETKARDILHFQDIEARMKEAEAERQKQAMLLQQQMGLDPNNPQNNQQQNQKNGNGKDKSKNPQQQPGAGGIGGGIKQVGDTMQPVGLPANASVANPTWQEHKKRMEVYDEFMYALREISKN